MKSWLSLLTLALMISAVSAFAATDGQYVVVLGRDAPASDAVIGANFAASMKATLGVTFTSAIDTDLYAQDAELGSRTFVVIDGEERKVRILGTSNAAAAAESYFQRLGFETELRAAAKSEDILLDSTAVQRDVPEKEQEEVDEIPAEEPANATNTTAELGIDAGLEIETNAQSPAAPDPLPPAQPAPRQQSVLARVFGWFKGLF